MDIYRPAFSGIEIVQLAAVHTRHYLELLYEAEGYIRQRKDIPEELVNKILLNKKINDKLETLANAVIRKSGG